MLGHEGRQRRFSRGRLARIAEITSSAELADLAASDIYWDEVASIELLGDMLTFDATVDGTHNFIANGVVAQNSIEQDADVVILLHRDDYYGGRRRADRQVEYYRRINATRGVYGVRAEVVYRYTFMPDMAWELA